MTKRTDAMAASSFSATEKLQGGITRRTFMAASMGAFASLALTGALAPRAQAAFIYPDIRPSQALTKTVWLSKYMPVLKGTNLDTPVYFFDSGKPGATGLFIGGTHPREIAGQTAAIMLAENVSVQAGRLMVLPFANRSAMSIPDTQGRVAHWHRFNSRSGPRFLPYGDRRTDIEDQGVPDPEKFQHPGGYVNKNGAESRNLNRCYPGLKDGTPTQKLAFGIVELVRREKIDFCLDCHEANTPDDTSRVNDPAYGKKGSRLAYSLISHPKGTEIAASAILDMEEDTAITLKLEESRRTYRGLSHLEIGDATDCASFLSESPNPGQNRLDKNPDVINHPKYPLKHRVGLHLRLFKHLSANYELMHDKPLTLAGIPEYKDLMDKGVGHFLN
jgi:hypothetical protein